MEKTTVKTPKAITADITCLDCGATRTVAIQDAKQVKRCTACQEVYRKAQQKKYRKNYIQSLRQKIETLEKRVAELTSTPVEAEKTEEAE